MKKEYTEGEFEGGGWKAHNDSCLRDGIYEIHFTEDGECVAEIVHGEANAKLIAAAPDLLNSIEYFFDVLKEVRGDLWDEKPDHVLSKMINAYKKATE